MSCSNYDDTVINLIFISLICVLIILIFMSEPRAKPIAVSLLLSLLSLLLLLFLPLPTGSLFGATGWDQESEVVLIIGRAPRIE